MVLALAGDSTMTRRRPPSAVRTASSPPGAPCACGDPLGPASTLRAVFARGGNGVSFSSCVSRAPGSPDAARPSLEGSVTRPATAHRLRRNPAGRPGTAASSDETVPPTNDPNPTKMPDRPGFDRSRPDHAPEPVDTGKPGRRRYIPSAVARTVSPEAAFGALVDPWPSESSAGRHERDPWRHDDLR